MKADCFIVSPRDDQKILKFVCFGEDGWICCNASNVAAQWFAHEVIRPGGRCCYEKPQLVSLKPQLQR